MCCLQSLPLFLQPYGWFCSGNRPARVHTWLISLRIYCLSAPSPTKKTRGGSVLHTRLRLSLFLAASIDHLCARPPPAIHIRGTRVSVDVSLYSHVQGTWVFNRQVSVCVYKSLPGPTDDICSPRTHVAGVSPALRKAARKRGVWLRNDADVGDA